MQTIFAKKVIKSEGAEGVNNLLLQRPLQIGLNESDLAIFHKGGYVILDFGKEMRGGIRILTSGSDLSPVRIRFGESVSECCAELGIGETYAGNDKTEGLSETSIRQNATNDHALRDVTVRLPNWSDMPVGDTGFRFVRLDFSGDCAIKSIVCNNRILTRRAKYIYRGDKQIEKIFQAAKRTIDLCASSGYIWDGVKRDRLVWVGDMAPEVFALTALYGRMEEIERSLDFAKSQAPLPTWMSGICTYSLWWIIIVEEYVKRTDAVDYAEQQIEYLEGLVKQIAEGVDEDGEMHYPSYFVDWPRAGFLEEREGFRAINIMATKSAICLLERFRRDTSVAKAHLTRIMKKEIQPNSRVVAALKYFAVGDLNEKEKALLLSDGVKGMSTFMAYYVLKAARAYDEKIADEMMKEYFGGMLKVGSTTFWEEFDLEWTKDSCPLTRLPKKGEKDLHGDFGDHCYVGFRKSLCHGWAAGVLAYIKER